MAQGKGFTILMTVFTVPRLAAYRARIGFTRLSKTVIPESYRHKKPSFLMSAQNSSVICPSSERIAPA
jgi:hypothetical protein